MSKEQRPLPGLNRRDVIKMGAAASAFVALNGPGFAQDSNQPVILITGTSSGFGRLMAEGFAREGAHVIATMRNVAGRNAAAADELSALADTNDLSLEVIEIDVLNEESVAAGVTEAIERTGRIDILVSNAGIVVPGPVELQPQSAFDANIETNAKGALRVIRAVVPHMRAAGQGTIIQVSSALGRAIDPTLGGYCASKLMIEAAIDAMSYELASSNIELAVVQPAGAYPTRFQTNGLRHWEELRARFDPDDPLLALYEPHIQAMLAGLEPDTTLDPNEVSDAIMRLAAMEFGTRPGRTTVGPYRDGIDPVNAAHDQLQNEMLQHNPALDLFTLG